jgi:hypothetical protein
LGIFLELAAGSAKIDDFGIALVSQVGPRQLAHVAPERLNAFDELIQILRSEVSIVPLIRAVAVVTGGRLDPWPSHAGSEMPAAISVFSNAVLILLAGNQSKRNFRSRDRLHAAAIVSPFHPGRAWSITLGCAIEIFPRKRTAKSA